MMNAFGGRSPDSGLEWNPAHIETDCHFINFVIASDFAFEKILGHFSRKGWTSFFVQCETDIKQTRLLGSPVNHESQKLIGFMLHERCNTNARHILVFC
jgi:hypothetical protein